MAARDPGHRDQYRRAAEAARSAAGKARDTLRAYTD
jgi:hypothetical protein